jgi:hypothetical protein
VALAESEVSAGPTGIAVMPAEEDSPSFRQLQFRKMRMLRAARHVAVCACTHCCITVGLRSMFLCRKIAASEHLPARSNDGTSRMSMRSVSCLTREGRSRSAGLSIVHTPRFDESMYIAACASVPYFGAVHRLPRACRGLAAHRANKSSGNMVISKRSPQLYKEVNDQNAIAYSKPGKR